MTFIVPVFTKLTSPQWYYVEISYTEIFAPWDVTQHRLVVTEILGRPIGPIFKAPAVVGLLDPRRWDQSGVLKCKSVTTNLCCITSQKREDLIYITADTWNNVYFIY